MDLVGSTAVSRQRITKEETGDTIGRPESVAGMGREAD
jgi:hypothetical protein